MSKNDANTDSLKISNTVDLPHKEVEFEAIRAQGAGGQHVNKVSSAVHLRFDINSSSLPEFYKERLLAYKDKRVSNDGIVVIKAQRFRSRDKNRDDALMRLAELIKAATTIQKSRRATKPTRGSQRRRVDSKTQRGKLKGLRKRVDY